MEARRVYEALVIAIEKACAVHGFSEVCDEAQRLGMSGGRANSLTSLRYDFKYESPDGGVVTLDVRSYDPSGPFQNEPDINRFTARLYENGQERTAYDRQYSD